MRPQSTQTFEWSQGFAEPVATGLSFLDDRSLFATRDHLQLSVEELSLVVRSLRGADWKGVTGGYPLDGQHVSYVGVSIGGLLGGVLAASEPNVSRFVLNSGAADLFGVVQESERIAPEFSARLSARGLEPGTPRYLLFEQAARWIFEQGDPIHLGELGRGQRVLLQTSTNDRVFPRSQAESLSRVFDVPLQLYTGSDKAEVGGHGFFLDPLDAEGTRARSAALQFLSAP